MKQIIQFPSPIDTNAIKYEYLEDWIIALCPFALQGKKMAVL
jgi:hypothetical protein